jgi:outer membrane immunogenic protein
VQSFGALHMNRLLAATSALAVLAAASQASAADLAARSAPVYTKAPEYVAVSNWTGWYIGGNVGYGWGNSDVIFGDNLDPGLTALGIPSQKLGNSVNGVFGGGQIGYNWQIGSIVTGLEADIQASGIKGTAQGPGAALFTPTPTETITASSESKLSWFGTVRGRLGVTVTPNLLLYGTGGLAYGEVSHSGNFVNTGDAIIIASPASLSQTKTGWAAGAGVEWMFSRGWSAKFEYLHVDLGGSSANGVSTFSGLPGIVSSIGYSWNNRFDTVRVGVNYHFN